MCYDKVKKIHMTPALRGCCLVHALSIKCVEQYFPFPVRQARWCRYTVWVLSAITMTACCDDLLCPSANSHNMLRMVQCFGGKAQKNTACLSPCCVLGKSFYLGQNKLHDAEVEVNSSKTLHPAGQRWFCTLTAKWGGCDITEICCVEIRHRYALLWVGGICVSLGLC